MDENRHHWKEQERFLLGDPGDFAAAYMAVSDLEYLFKKEPSFAVPETVRALDRVLECPLHANQKQVYFLYRKTATILASMISHEPCRPLAGSASSVLETKILNATGPLHRAVTEALGGLPVSVPQPRVPDAFPEDAPAVPWREIQRLSPVHLTGKPRRLGRTAVFHASGKDRVLAVKAAAGATGCSSLHREASWMERLRREEFGAEVRFDLPRPLPVGSGGVFRPEDFSLPNLAGREISSPVYALAYETPAAYFRYPNEPGEDGRLLPPQRFLEVMRRSAFLLGRLAGRGMVHEAPIPLFHNRVQRNRRSDGGVYEWSLGGRLDRWLESCRYPNFGETGLRDFEHIVVPNGHRGALYRFIGNHFLSLLLVGGSYFRARDPERVGRVASGRRADARDLFDPVVLETLLREVFAAYYGAFTESPIPKTAASLPFEKLTARMIEEMGMDRHMEEVLRAVDQTRMTRSELEGFLRRRGVPEEEAEGIEPGKADVTLHTGPHLGGFNQRISLPELLEFVGTSAALCVLGRFRRHQKEGVSAAA